MKCGQFNHENLMSIQLFSIVCMLAFLSAAATTTAADGPRLRLQAWATATHVYWIRTIAPNQVAVSYFNTGPRHGSGLDVLDSSGTLVRRVWPLPDGTYCAAVYPDGRLFLRRDDDGSSWNLDIPAVVRPNGVVTVGVSPTHQPSLMFFDSSALDDRSFAQGVFHPTQPSRIQGLEGHADGRLLVWGELKLADGGSSTLIRINLDETLDQDFHPAIMGSVRSLRIGARLTIHIEKP
jgi:hypothetical protein